MGGRRRRGGEWVGREGEERRRGKWVGGEGEEGSGWEGRELSNLVASNSDPLHQQEKKKAQTQSVHACMYLYL